MNKAVMISIAPKWFKMIKSGTKTLEFRNYGIPKGTKVYLRETLGDRKHIDKWESYPEYICWRDDNGEGKMLDYITEGTGQVVAEFVVGEKYQLQLNFDNTVSMYYGDVSNFMNNEPLNKPREILGNYGYTNQQYAHTITDLIVYDAPIPYTEFVSWNKFNKYKDYILDYNCNLTSAPQGKVYVVEKDIQ